VRKITDFFHLLLSDAGFSDKAPVVGVFTRWEVNPLTR
jgi:hypothetical protein